MVHEQQKQTSDRTFLQLIHGWLQAINSQSVNYCCAYQAVDSGELSKWNINENEILKTFFYWILKFWVVFAPAGLFKPWELLKARHASDETENIRDLEPRAVTEKAVFPSMCCLIIVWQPEAYRWIRVGRNYLTLVTLRYTEVSCIKVRQLQRKQLHKYDSSDSFIPLAPRLHTWHLYHAKRWSSESLSCSPCWVKARGNVLLLCSIKSDSAASISFIRCKISRHLM